MKAKILNDAIDNGIEGALKMAKLIKARSKLQDYFVSSTGLTSWNEVKDNYPSASAELEKFVEPKMCGRKIIPENFINFVEMATSHDQPDIAINIQVELNEEDITSRPDIQKLIKEHTKRIRDSVAQLIYSSGTTVVNEAVVNEQ